jgi:hypothetical protein
LQEGEEDVEEVDPESILICIEEYERNIAFFSEKKRR